MFDLSQKTCEACRPDAPKATDDEISGFYHLTQIGL